MKENDQKKGCRSILLRFIAIYFLTIAICYFFIIAILIIKSIIQSNIQYNCSHEFKPNSVIECNLSCVKCGYSYIEHSYYDGGGRCQYCGSPKCSDGYIHFYTEGKCEYCDKFFCENNESHHYINSQNKLVCETCGKLKCEESGHTSKVGKCNYCQTMIGKESPVFLFNEYCKGNEYRKWFVTIENKTNKTIKYIYVEWDCFNAVGDMVYDAYGKEKSFEEKLTGPIYPNSNKELQTHNYWKNYDYAYKKWKLLKIEYTDGSEDVVIKNGKEKYYNIFEKEN